MAIVEEEGGVAMIQSRYAPDLHSECCCGTCAHFACGGVWRWEPEQTGPHRHALKVLAAVKSGDKCQFA